MVGRSRVASGRLSSSSESRDNSVDGEDFENLQPKHLKDDDAYDRKFLVAKTCLSLGGFYLLRHPRSGCASLYHIGTDVNVSELLKVGQGKRSIFYGDSVVSDGTINLVSPIHPLFLVIYYLQKDAQNRFLSIEDILEDSEFLALRLLTASKKLKKSLNFAAESKELDDRFYYRYSEEKLLVWLSKRFDILSKSLAKNADLGGHILSDDASFRRYTFGVLCDFVPESIILPLKERLDIKDLMVFVAPLKVTSASKRKQSDENVVPLKKSAALNKKAQQAIKGTKSIISFFSKQ